MTIYNSKLWSAIDSARTQLAGSYHYEHETGIEYNFPPKDKIIYSKAYEYCFGVMDIFLKVAEIIDEIKLIKAQVQYSQDFAMNNKEFSTDFILNFSYKNWVIRVNIITEQLVFLTNEVYSLKLSSNNVMNNIFEHPRVKDDKSLYLALLNLIDFLHENLMSKVKFKNFKKIRNEIVHKSNFNHDLIKELSYKLLDYQYGISENKHREDIYIEEGIASEKIKNEIISLTSLFLEKLTSLYNLLSLEFSDRFSQLLKLGEQNRI